MTMLRFLRPIVFFGLLLLGAPGALAQNADERVVARELTKALTRATGETGDVRLSGAVPALETPAAAIAVSDIDFDPRSRRFTAVVMMPVPSGFVRTNVSPGRAPTLRTMRSG